MDMTAMYEAMDIIVLVCGVYALYAAWVLKTEGKIIKTFLVSKDKDPASCKDLPAYAARMSPKLGVLGSAMTAYGAVAEINARVVDIPTLYWVFFGIFVLVLIWYGMEVKKALEQYF